MPNVDKEPSKLGARPRPAIRVGFVDGSCADVLMGGSSLNIGSDAGCDVVLPAADAAAWHAIIHHDRRGLVLEVKPTAARVYVNARPVRELALLRVGDVLSIGGCKLILRQPLEDASQHRRHGDVPVLPASLVALRVVAGPGAGKRLAIDDELVLDALLLPGCVGHVRLRRGAGAVSFDVLGPLDDQPPRFNGNAVESGELHVGDQLAWRNYRFVVEAPGVALAEDHVRFLPREEALPEQTAGPSNEVWWLIATASVLAFCIALLLILKL